MAEKQPITIAEHNALSISNALNFGYYYVQGAIDITHVLVNGQATDRYVNALRQWDLPIGSWKVFLAHHPYVKFASRRSLRIEQHPGWRFGSPRPQEIDSLQSNVVWYEAERVVCLYHQASLGANLWTPTWELRLFGKSGRTGCGNRRDFLLQAWPPWW